MPALGHGLCVHRAGLERAEAARTSTGYAPGVTSVNNDGAVTFSDGALAEKQVAKRTTFFPAAWARPHGLLYRGVF